MTALIFFSAFSDFAHFKLDGGGISRQALDHQ